MSFFRESNPWQEAAGYGQGLGSVLEQIILKLPQLRAEQQYRQQMMPGQMALQGAQLADVQAQTAERQAQPGIEQKRVELESQRLKETDFYRRLAVLSQMQQHANTAKYQTGELSNRRIQQHQQAQHQAVMEDIAKEGMLNKNIKTEFPTDSLGQTGMLPSGQVNPQYSSMTNQLGQLMQKILGGVGMTNNVSEAPPQQKPPTAINPQTGQRLILMNGQWTPLQ